VRRAGGLHILGTERHESRRIDNQLRGRAGRQGDPGSSQFFVSMEDDLMRLFGGERMKSLMNTLGIPDDQPVEARLVSRSIESSQKRIEGLNFDTRKHVLEFDDVLNHQRNVIYKMRREFLPGLIDTTVSSSPTPGEEVPEGRERSSEDGKNEAKDIKDQFLDLLREEIAEVVTFTSAAEGSSLDETIKQIGAIFPVTPDLKSKILAAQENAANKEFAIIDVSYLEAEKMFNEKEQEMGGEIFDGAMRFVALQSIDQLWMEHLDTMDHLRDSVRLRGYGQRDPLIEYKREGYEMFQRLLKEINKQIVYSIFKISVQVRPRPDSPKNLVTNKTDGSENQNVGKSDNQNIGRNDPCPCGSGKKWKKCGMLNTEEHQKNMVKAK
jgi:preprotein translocase subunit SecA